MEIDPKSRVFYLIYYYPSDEIFVQFVVRLLKLYDFFIHLNALSDH